MATTIKSTQDAADAALLTNEIDELSIVNAITKLIFEIDEPLTPLEREVLSLLPTADGLFQDCNAHEVGEYLRTFAKWELMNLVERLKNLLMIDPSVNVSRVTVREIIYQH
jgi:hypothetical protein